MKPMNVIVGNRPNAFVWGILVALLGSALMAAPSFAQDDAKADKSGTNPINFTNDLRLYYEYQDLSAGGELHIGTFEGRTPALDGKLQLRVRVTLKSGNSPLSAIPALPVVAWKASGSRECFTARYSHAVPISWDQSAALPYLLAYPGPVPSNGLAI